MKDDMTYQSHFYSFKTRSLCLLHFLCTCLALRIKCMIGQVWTKSPYGKNRLRLIKPMHMPPLVCGRTC